MKKFVIPLLILIGVCGAVASSAKDDFLNAEEVNKIRDAEDGGKRVLLYLEFAQQRLQAAQEKTATKEEGAGRAIQKNLAEFNSILEALEDALDAARLQRAPLSQALKELENQGNHFLKVLQQLQQAPNRSDYQFTLDEAVEMTNDELAEAKKGAFPEVKERKPPTDLPAKPPAASKSGDNEEGPPRKKARSAN